MRHIHRFSTALVCAFVAATYWRAGAAVGGPFDRGLKVYLPNASETELYTKVAKDCTSVDFTTWRHPTKSVLRRKRSVETEWVQLCNGRTYAVFGVRFKYDPLGRTNAYFTPLYLEMLEANGGHAFSFVSLSDDLIINLRLLGKRRPAVTYEPFFR